MSHYLPFILLLIGGTVLTVGDIIMKEWTTHDNALYFFAGLFVYMIGLTFLAHSYKYENIAIASIIFVIVNIVTLLGISAFYFKETLSPFQMVAIVFGISAVVMLEAA